MTQVVAISTQRTFPALIAAAGDRAAYRILKFFTAQIRTPTSESTDKTPPLALAA